MIPHDHTIELSEKMAVIAVPENAVEISLSIKVFNNGDIVKVGRTLGMSEVQAAIREADLNYIPDNAVFSVTEKGLKMLEELEPNV